jgi:hypothetical protein
MGAPVPKMEPIDNGTAEALLSSLQSIDPTERRKHASIFNYWLSIRGDRQFPPIRDLDPLEISDAGPWSVLLELIGNGENAVIRHLGQDIKLGIDAETIARVPSPSLLACIHAQLPTIASSMQALAFEDSFEARGGTTRCWVTLLPFSSSGTSIDYVYGFVSLQPGESEAAAADASADAQEFLEPGQVPLGPMDGQAETAEAELTDMVPDEADPQPETEALELAPEPEPAPEAEPEFEPETLETEPEVESNLLDQPLEPLADFESDPAPLTEPGREALTDLSDIEPQPDPEPEETADLAAEPGPEAEEGAEAPAKAGFSARFMESLANVGGFYGRVVHPADPGNEESFVEESGVEESPVEEQTDEATDFAEAVAEGPVAEEPTVDIVTEPTCATEGTLQSKLTEVRAMAEEAHQAQLRAQAAIVAGLSAAYDFALDAENEPEEYLRLVEGQGLKIQLRAPMKPVVKLAFAETCDDATIGQLEAVLAWALKQDLPRGTLVDRIEAEGGIGSVLEGLGKAA